jgi:sugar (pentulose or hexulose) kinase
MVLSTRDSTADVYIVVLDVASDVVRALLFDFEARRVEGYSAQLPRRAQDAEAGCLDEMHRLVQADGFRVGAVAGRAESEVTEEDRKFWPAFAGAKFLPALPDGAALLIGSGCVNPAHFALAMGEVNIAGAVLDRPATVEGLHCTPLDEKRWLLAGPVPEAASAHAALKQAAKGSVERYLENAAPDDPLLALIDAAGRRFRDLSQGASEVIGCGSALLKSPTLSQRIAHALRAPMTLSTEPEPVCRGSALWALEKIGAIPDMSALPASMGPVFKPAFMETTQ